RLAPRDAQPSGQQAHPQRPQELGLLPLEATQATPQTQESDPPISPPPGRPEGGEQSPTCPSDPLQETPRPLERRPRPGQGRGQGARDEAREGAGSDPAGHVLPPNHVGGEELSAADQGLQLGQGDGAELRLAVGGVVPGAVHDACSCTTTSSVCRQKELAGSAL